MKSILACLAIVVMSCSQLHAQPKDLLPSRTISFEHLVMAESAVVDGKPQFVMTVDAYQMQQTTLLEPESRIRLDTADGKTLLLKYSGPKTEVLKNVVTAIVPVGQRRVAIPGSDVRFFRLSGERISMDEAAAVLTKPRPIFLLENQDGKPPKLPDTYQQAVDPNCLIAITNRKVREIPAEEAAPIRDAHDPVPPEAIKRNVDL